MAQKRRYLTPPYGYLARLFRPFPNFDPSFIRPVRQKAVALLNLREGDRVLDVGCGPGGSFPYLVRAVGQSGQVVVVETSPEISINARRRIRAPAQSSTKPSQQSACACFVRSHERESEGPSTPRRSARHGGAAGSLAFPNDLPVRARAVDTMLTVPRSLLFFNGHSCSQPCEGANVSRKANTRFSVHCSAN